MVSPNDLYLLSNFLFHLRTPLYSFKGALQLANQMQEKIPVSVFNWLEKWASAVDRWISAEEKAHSFIKDGAVHDWKQIVYDIAENMEDVSIAYAEGKSLEMPESPEGKMIVNLALGNGFKYLNEIIQPILSRDYSHL